MDDPERVDYQDGAKVKPPVKATDLPARPSADAPDGGTAAGGGPGAKRRNVSPARPRDAALER